MKLGVLTVVLYDRSLEKTMKYLSGLGVDCLEIGLGGFPGSTHLDPQEILSKPGKVEEVKGLLDKYNMTIAALSCHGNPVHPDPKIAGQYHEQFTNAVLAAEKLGVDTVVGFSGCPGDAPGAKHPNWVVVPWPDDFTEVLEYQWNEVLIPYWKKMAAFCRDHGVKKIAFEMHPGFCVYNPYTLLRLREAVGDIVGANFDPSHLFWQGVDPCAAIKELKGAIYHFHAKDTRIDRQNCAVNGVLDTRSYSLVGERSWVFRTVGYGHSLLDWNDIISALKVAGYDGAISIEHEDALMSPTEGLEKAIANLQQCLIRENPSDIWWA